MEKVPAVKNPRTEKILKKIHSFEGKLAEKITDFSGSMIFAYVNLIWFALWIVINQGWFSGFIEPFDPFPYGLLTMIVSLEAIFLATFIMVAQNRQELIDQYREIEEDIEEQETEAEVDDIQKDLDEIKSVILVIQEKISNVERKSKLQSKTSD